MIANRIKHGIVGGLMGGVVFGVMMAFMGVLPMIGKMVGYPNAVVGFLVHMVISAGIGGSFGLLVGPAVTGKISGLFAGMAYGMFWWFLGPLTLMPFFMGMGGLGVNWNPAAAASMLPSLMGHAVFGLVLGMAYSRGENCLILKLGGSGDQTSAEKPKLRAVS
jgi:hypothetical protein